MISFRIRKCNCTLIDCILSGPKKELRDIISGNGRSVLSFCQYPKTCRFDGFVSYEGTRFAFAFAFAFFRFCDRKLENRNLRVVLEKGGVGREVKYKACP